MKHLYFPLICLILCLTTSACREYELEKKTGMDILISDFSHQRTFGLYPSERQLPITLRVNGYISDDVAFSVERYDDYGKWVTLNTIILPKGNYSNKILQFEHQYVYYLNLVISASHNTTGNLTINWQPL